MGPGVPLPGCFLVGSRVPIPGCFTFFTAVWHVFHPTFLDVNLHMVHHRFWSSTTFIDFNVNVPFRITDADQSIKSAQSITGFWNAHKPLVIIRITSFHASRDVHYSVNVLSLRPSNADSPVFLASFIAAQVNTRVSSR